MSEPVTIKVEHPDQPEVAALLKESDAYYAKLYPAESNHLLDIDKLKRPKVKFHVARAGGRVLGFGALVRHGDKYGEIKRMYLAPQARGKGIGRMLLEALEAEAVAQGFARIRLETGQHQPEALSLYRSSGYREIGPFGMYVADPNSVFMEKRLAPRR